jgi:hypothetical protein
MPEEHGLRAQTRRWLRSGDPAQVRGRCVFGFQFNAQVNRPQIRLACRFDSDLGHQASWEYRDFAAGQRLPPEAG